MPVAEEIPPAPPSGPGFSQAVLDSLTASIAVLDRDGVIVCVNQAWRRFATENGGGEGTGAGANYLAVSRLGAGPYAEEAQAAYEGIKAVLDGRQPEFSLKYPCHDGAQKRWFLLQATPMTARAGGGAVISHQDITARK
jgi:PAS domain-containing protein